MSNGVAAGYRASGLCGILNCRWWLCGRKTAPQSRDSGRHRVDAIQDCPELPLSAPAAALLRLREAISISPEAGAQARFVPRLVISVGSASELRAYCRVATPTSICSTSGDSADRTARHGLERRQWHVARGRPRAGALNRDLAADGTARLAGREGSWAYRDHRSLCGPPRAPRR